MSNFSEKHYFPGGNTPKGFFSYYNNILDAKNAKHIYCLKGGPGVGKSSFMKKIASSLKQEDIKIDYLHCSSDPQSLDGIILPENQIIVVDGTSPHIIDPEYPGAIDEIINLGEYWNRTGIEINREEIVETKHNISYEYKGAYKYLSAAAAIEADTDMLYQNATSEGEINGMYSDLSKKVFADRRGNGTGKIKSAFASAVTPAGLVNYSDTLLYDCEHVFALKIGDGLISFNGADNIMARLKNEAVQRGFDVELYYCPMKPDERIEHIVIPEIKTGVTVLNKYSNDEMVATDIVDLMTCVNRAEIRATSQRIQENDEMYSKLLLLAEKSLKNAYWLHNTLESYYVPNMDFSAQNKRCGMIIDEIKALLRQ